MLRQITQRVYGFPLVTNFKMQRVELVPVLPMVAIFCPAFTLVVPGPALCRYGRRHSGNHHMFDDNQITVAAQRVTGINNGPSAVAIIACPLLPAISIPLCPPQKRQRFRSLCPQSASASGDRRTG